MPRADKYEHEQHVHHHNPLSGAPAHYYHTQFSHSSYLQNASPSSATTSSPRSPPPPLSPPNSQQSSSHPHHHQSSLSFSSQSSQASPQHTHSQALYQNQHPHPQQMSPLPSILSLTSVPLTGASAPPKTSLSGPGAPSSIVVLENGKKKHVCGTCERSFTTSGHLARHSRVHTGERNHKCPFPGCETRCSRQDNLQQHYRIHLSPGSRRSATRGRGKGKRASTASSSATGGDGTDGGAGSPSTTSASISAGGMPYGSSSSISHHASKSASPRTGTPPPALEQARLVPGPNGGLYYPGTGQHMVTPPDTPPALAHATLPATASMTQLNLPLVMGMQPHPATQNMPSVQPQTTQTHTPQVSHSSPTAQTSHMSQQQQQTQATATSTRSSPEAQYPGSASDDAVPALVPGLNYRYIGPGSMFNTQSQSHAQSQQQLNQQQHQQHSPHMPQEPTASAIAAYSHAHSQQHALPQSQHSSPNPNLSPVGDQLPQYIAAHQSAGYSNLGTGGEPSRVPSPAHQQQPHLRSRHSISHISHPHSHTQSSLMAVSSGGGSMSSITSTSSGVSGDSLVASGMVAPDSPTSLPSSRTPPSPSYNLFQSAHAQQQHHQQQQQQVYNGYSHHQQQQPMQQLSPAVYNSATAYTPPLEHPTLVSAPAARFPSPPPTLAPIMRSGNAQVVPREKYTYTDGERYSDVSDVEDTRYDAVRYAEEPRYGGQQQQQQHYQHAQMQQQHHYQQQQQAQQYQQSHYQAQQHHAQQQHAHHAQHQHQQHDSPYMQQPAGGYASYHNLGHGAWKSETSGMKRNVGTALV